MSERHWISVEYDPVVAVKLDAETLEVVDVILHAEDFNGTLPFQVFSDDADYLERGSELYDRATAVAARVEITPGDVHLPFRLHAPEEQS